MGKKVFAYIWEYTVKKEHLTEYKKYYDPNGNWVQLFRKADGFIKTDLHQDLSDPRRFITVDFWKNKESRDVFRKDFMKEFERIDQHCESFTENEKFLGDFDTFIN